MSASEKHQELAKLTSSQRADFDAAMEAMKGVSTRLAGLAFASRLTPGNDYRGRPKWWMARDYALREELGKRHCLHLTPEKIRDACKAIVAQNGGAA